MCVRYYLLANSLKRHERYWLLGAEADMTETNILNQNENCSSCHSDLKGVFVINHLERCGEHQGEI